jgi:hypothetical protein
MTQKIQAQEKLLELQKKLLNSSPKNEKQKRARQELLDNIQAYLDADEQDETPENMLEKMENGIEEFEATHPTLALYLNDTLQILSSLGI